MAVRGDGGQRWMGLPRPSPTSPGYCCSLGTRMPPPAAWPWRSGHPWPLRCLANPWYVEAGCWAWVSPAPAVPGHCSVWGCWCWHQRISVVRWSCCPCPREVGAGGASTSPQHGGGFPAQGWVTFRCFEAPLGSKLHVTAYTNSRDHWRLSQWQWVPGEPPACPAAVAPSLLPADPLFPQTARGPRHRLPFSSAKVGAGVPQLQQRRAPPTLVYVPWGELGGECQGRR